MIDFSTMKKKLDISYLKNFFTHHYRWTVNKYDIHFLCDSMKVLPAIYHFLLYDASNRIVVNSQELFKFIMPRWRRTDLCSKFQANVRRTTSRANRADEQRDTENDNSYSNLKSTIHIAINNKVLRTIV